MRRRDGYGVADGANMESIQPPVPEGPDDEPPVDELPLRRFDAWRRRTAIGGIATGVALGLKEVFQPSNEEPVITAEAPGDPPDAGERLRVILDPEDPTKSVAILPPDGTSPPAGPG